jgi:hypothetical protein
MRNSQQDLFTVPPLLRHDTSRMQLKPDPEQSRMTVVNPTSANLPRLAQWPAVKQEADLLRLKANLVG